MMTPTEFVAALEAWCVAGGRFPEISKRPYCITTAEQAEAVCRALLSTHIYAVNSIQSPALDDLVAFFNFAETEAALDVLRRKGLDLLRGIFRDALAQPPKGDPDDWANPQLHHSHVFILQILAKFQERGDAALIIAGARDRRMQDGFWNLVFDIDDKGHPEAQDIFEALRERLPDGGAGVMYLHWANNLAREQQIARHPFAAGAGIGRLARYLSDPDPDNHFNAECATAALPFVSASARTKLLDIADQHPDGRVSLGSRRGASADWFPTRRAAPCGALPRCALQ